MEFRCLWGKTQGIVTGLDELRGKWLETSVGEGSRRVNPRSYTSLGAKKRGVGSRLRDWIGASDT